MSFSGKQNNLTTDTTNTLNYKNRKQNNLYTDTTNTLRYKNGIFTPSLFNYSYFNILHIYQRHKKDKNVLL